MTGGRFRAFASSARVANLPSVVTNVCAGALLAGGKQAAIPLTTACLCGVLLCLGGNLLNDWADRRWDAHHRPERALPRGLFRPGTYLMAALFSIAAALVTAAWFARDSLAAILPLIACIALYTWLHKKTPLAILPMAACRALLPVAGALAAGGVSFPALFYSSALFLYIAGLSMFARGESRNETGGKPWLAACFLAGVMAASIAGFSIFLVPLIFFFWWLSPVVLRRKWSVGTKVSRLLAGITLLDLLAITRSTAGGGWLTVLGFLAAFGAAVLLQRLAAAT